MFSVVVPVWNKAHTLRRTIDHALAQSFAGFELILVDDGSTDGSLDTIADMRDPRLRIVSQPNAGPGPARNRGIAEARHSWIAFLDADDLWLPGHLAELDRIRRAFPDAGLIGTRFAVTDRSGRFSVPPEEPGIVERACFFDRIGSGEPMLFTSSAAVPANLVRALGGFESFARGEDSELWARIALERPVARSTRTTVVYMRGTGGITDTLPKAWGSGPPRRIEDISPAVALVLRRQPGVASAAIRAAIERYVERALDWALRQAIRNADTGTLRALPSLYRRPPPPLHRLLLRLARLPVPLALAACRTVLTAEAVALRLRRIASTGRDRAPASPPPSPPGV